MTDDKLTALDELASDIFEEENQQLEREAFESLLLKMPEKNRITYEEYREQLSKQETS